MNPAARPITANDRGAHDRGADHGLGLAPGVAPGVLATVQRTVVPHLVRAHRPPGENPCLAAPTTPVLHSQDVAEMAELLLGPDPAAASALLDRRHRQGVAADALYLDLLAPAARYLGDLWAQDLCEFGDVTVGLCHLRQVMRDFSPTFLDGAERSDPRRRALLTTVPGEQHSFGLFMVAEFFRRAGWEVTAAAPGSRQDLAALARRDWYAVVGVSASCASRLDMVESCVRTVRQVSRNRSVGIMVGGPAFVAQPSLAGQVGADGYATDGREAPVVAEKLLAEMPARP